MLRVYLEIIDMNEVGGKVACRTLYYFVYIPFIFFNSTDSKKNINDQISENNCVRLQICKNMINSSSFTILCNSFFLFESMKYEFFA